MSEETRESPVLGPDGKPCTFSAPREPFRLEFFAWETVGYTDIDFGDLVAKLQTDDDCVRYREAYNGAPFKQAERGSGSTDIEVLPRLKGKPFDNLALAWLHALRPSSIRVSHGTICCDSQRWRVTVWLDDKELITKVTQEVEIGYGCGGDVENITRCCEDGRLPMPSSGVCGHVKGLERVDFE